MATRVIEAEIGEDVALVLDAASKRLGVPFGEIVDRALFAMINYSPEILALQNAEELLETE